MASSGGMNPEDLQAQIDDLKVQITALQSRHNAASLIGRLPPELLSHIFGMLSYIWPRWIRVTHVCRHWREVALDCTGLWSRITFSHSDFTQVKLARSKRHPLTVEYDSNIAFASASHLAMALLSPDNLRHVHLSGDASTFSGHLRRWKLPCASLETLSLRMRASTFDFLPSGFLGGPSGVPLLISLEHIFCHGPWRKLPLGPSLTTLKLQEPCSLGSHRPSVKDFSMSLQHMPLLETLDLHGFLPLKKAVLHVESPVLLSNLQRLQVEDIPESLAQLFCIIRLPRSATHLSVVFVPDEADDKATVDAVCKLTLRHLKYSLGIDDEGGIPAHELDIYGAMLELRSPRGNSESPGAYRTILIGGSFEDCVGDVSSPLEILKETFNLTDLQSLKVDGRVPAAQSPEVWQYLGGLPNIASICLRGGRLADIFFKALKPQKTRSFLAAPQPNFPALSTLTLEMVTFGSSSPIDQWEYVQGLIATLKKRHHISHPLSELRFKHLCVLKEEELSRIQGSVPGLKVEWCGHGSLSWEQLGDDQR